MTLMTKSFLLLLLLADFKSFLKFKLVLFKKNPTNHSFFHLLKIWYFTSKSYCYRDWNGYFSAFELLKGDRFKTRWSEEVDENMNHTV